MSRKGVNALLLQSLFAFLRGVFGTLLAGLAVFGLVWLVMSVIYP